MNRIEWADGMYSGSVGHVTIAKSRVKIASISYSARRNDPKPWVLRTEIPGWSSARHFDTIESAQAASERIVQHFVDAMLQLSGHGTLADLTARLPIGSGNDA
jgi:hypothetical protein